jgi:hypothetical protein
VDQILLERSADPGKLREGRVAPGMRLIPQTERRRFEELAENFLTGYRIDERRFLEKAERGVRQPSKVFAAWRAMDSTTPDVRSDILHNARLMG